jgi:hypothetical protein
VVKQSKVNIDDDSVTATAAAATINAVPGSNQLRERDIRKSLLFLVRKDGSQERAFGSFFVFALVCNASYQDTHSFYAM